ncbi:MAG: hypothetical protein QXI55_06550, partial [Thermofilum sp.]
GSAWSLVNLTRPFTALVEAAPGRCSRLVELLVNGTPVSGSRFSLEVGGNTTVKAVFARYCVVARFEVAGPGSVLVNGSAVVNGSELEVEPGATLLVALEAAERFEKALYVNGTRLQGCPGCWAPVEVYPVAIRGDTELRAVFEPRRAVLHIDTGGLPAIISSGDWWQQVNGSATIGVEAGSVVNLTIFCKPDGDKLLCALGWVATVHTPLGVVNGSLLPNATLTVLGDTTLKAIVARVVSPVPPPVKGAVLFNGAEAPAEMIPDPFEAYPGWSAEFKYLGNGTWLIDSPAWGSFFLEISANWSRATVELWVEQSYPGIHYIAVEAVINESAVPEFGNRLLQHSKGCYYGWVLKPGAYFRVTLTRGGEALEASSGWDCEGERWWVEYNPAAVKGRLYMLFGFTRVRMRVAVQP